MRRSVCKMEINVYLQFNICRCLAQVRMDASVNQQSVQAIQCMTKRNRNPENDYEQFQRCYKTQNRGNSLGYLKNFRFLFRCSANAITGSNFLDQISAMFNENGVASTNKDGIQKVFYSK